MNLCTKIIILYLFLYAPSFAGIEPMINICKESSFLKCTNKNKQECENAINFTNSYCDKKITNNSIGLNKHESFKMFKECSNNSILAYFDNNSEKFYTCWSKTLYKQRLNKYIEEISNK